MGGGGGTAWEAAASGGGEAGSGVETGMSGAMKLADPNGDRSAEGSTSGTDSVVRNDSSGTGSSSYGIRGRSKPSPERAPAPGGMANGFSRGGRLVGAVRGLAGAGVNDGGESSKAAGWRIGAASSVGRAGGRSRNEGRAGSIGSKLPGAGMAIGAAMVAAGSGVATSGLSSEAARAATSSRREIGTSMAGGGAGARKELTTGGGRVAAGVGSKEDGSGWSASACMENGVWKSETTGGAGGMSGVAAGRFSNNSRMGTMSSRPGRVC